MFIRRVTTKLTSLFLAIMAFLLVLAGYTKTWKSEFGFDY